MYEILDNMLTELIHKYGFEHKEVIRFATLIEDDFDGTYESFIGLSLLHLKLMGEEI